MRSLPALLTPTFIDGHQLAPKHSCAQARHTNSRQSEHESIAVDCTEKAYLSTIDGMRNLIAPIAFAVGLIAVAMAAFQNDFVFSPPQQVESKRTPKEVAAGAAKALLAEKLLHKESPPKPVTDTRTVPMHPYQKGLTALGVIAVGLGTFAWTQRAHTRLAASAVGLGLIAVAWKWVLIAVGVALLIFVLSLLG